MKNIVLAGGCFWGVEAYFKLIHGVTLTKVGYANGSSANPTYEDVCTKTTGHTEACYIEYNEHDLDIDTLLEAYWKIIDPTLLDRQGGDIGNQYRTGIYYYDTNDYSTIIASKNTEQAKYHLPIVTEILPLKVFWDAEIYHQNYLDKNPTGYCHINLDL